MSFRRRLSRHVVETGEPGWQIPIGAKAIDASWLKSKVLIPDEGMATPTWNRSARKKNELKLAKRAAFTKSIIASSPFPTICTDLNGTITSVNPAAERMLRYTKQNLIGKETPLILLDPQEVVMRATILSEELHVVIEPGMAVLTAKPRRRLVEEAEWRLVRRDGTHVDAQLTVCALTAAAGETIGLILIAYDITERKRSEDYVANLALYDALTGLPTGSLFYDQLGVALARADHNQGKVGLLLMNLDNFKRLNDRMGREVGDELLTNISQRLRSSVRQTDIVARLGGDEFVIVLEDLHTFQEAEYVAENLLSRVQTPIEVGSQTFSPTASIGICLYPENGDNSEALLKNAAAAMWQAKANGRNGYQTFTFELESILSRGRQLEAGLHKALALNEFELFYQPQICMRTGKITGVEALLRWRSSTMGMVMPNDFIALAEESGLIVPIGEWVLRTACRQGRELQSEMGTALTIAVNISPRQFENGLPRVIRQALEESNLDPASLEIEITENILVSDSPKATDILKEIRSTGVRISIDDFGTGFSGMSYIMRFPVDRLKIDQSFIRNMAIDSASSAITSAVIGLARNLNINVVAEGVETAAHRDLLLSKSCNHAQGYFYSRPVPFESLSTVIRAIEEADCPINIECSVPSS